MVSELCSAAMLLPCAAQGRRRGQHRSDSVVQGLDGVTTRLKEAILG